MNKEKNFILKFLFIFLAFLFCFFIFSTNSKASYDFTYNNVDYKLNLPDAVDESKVSNVIVHMNSNKNIFTFYIFYFSNVRLACDSRTYFFYTTDGTPLKNYYEYSFICSYYINENSFSGVYRISDLNVDTSTTVKFATSDYRILYSTCDVYDINLENLVFPGSLPVLEAVEVQKLQIIQEIPEIIIKMIRMIIPVCLVIFSTLLLVYLIQLVIYRIL